jgi:hypothetical protein
MTSHQQHTPLLNHEEPSSLKQLSECQFFSTVSLPGYSKTLTSKNYLCIGVDIIIIIIIKYLVQ